VAQARRQQYRQQKALLYCAEESKTKPYQHSVRAKKKMKNVQATIISKSIGSINNRKAAGINIREIMAKCLASKEIRRTVEK